MVYLTLFTVSFLAATLLPLGSEALLLYDISQNYSLLFLWSVATFGNTLGSMVNYWLGLKGEAYLEEKEYLSVKKWIKPEGFLVNMEDGHYFCHGFLLSGTH